MKLYRCVDTDYIDPWGRKHVGCLFVTDVVEVEKNDRTTTVDDGYTGPREAPHWQAEDGREWVEITNRIDPWGGRWYKPNFEEAPCIPFEPGLVRPRPRYLDENQIERARLVDRDGKAINLNGERLI